MNLQLFDASQNTQKHQNPVQRFKVLGQPNAAIEASMGIMGLLWASHFWAFGYQAIQPLNPKPYAASLRNKLHAACRLPVSHDLKSLLFSGLVGK